MADEPQNNQPTVELLEVETSEGSKTYDIESCERIDTARDGFIVRNPDEGDAEHDKWFPRERVFKAVIEREE